MDEATKRKILQVMQATAGGFEMRPKLPFAISDPDAFFVKLIACYGNTVRSRGGEFQLDDNTVSKAQKVIKWIQSPQKHGLLLVGSLGNGKTTMLQVFSRLLGKAGMYFTAKSLYDHFRQYQNFSLISSHTILMIDELGVEPPSYNDFGQTRFPLTELLTSRYHSNSTTIIATNLTFEQIMNTYGERLADRMNEMYAFIEYKEPSYRGR